MTSPAATRGREVRLRLLDAAAELIAERGWAAVSTRILAERAGVTPSVVHYHFPSLPALLREAAVGAMRQVLAEVDAVLRTARTPAEAVDAMLTAVREYTGTDPRSLLAVEAYLAAGRDPRLRARIGELVEEFQHRLGRWLAEHGVPSAGETAGVLAAALDGLLLRRGLEVGPAPEPTTAVLRRLVEPEGEGGQA
ncbi:TetR/AcrR family transcriptional regulator [Amycolatopsis cihanbeyliensis]|uniref:TetR family transcriptional regulator n=1 Tax=Amycolatopsis cihanbeyliensis TaxID=1128664 RepID=A0A542CSA3_AMYCI|nr:TetR/AcrR family transcriptional regulator [Amycolatopsis cihanbeyliensis]TQI93704.1 TetR family transcriptional regulator [Amycolatopsis cihanbeyliensis]